MRKIYVIAVGRLSKEYRQLEREFLKRIRNLEIIEIRRSNSRRETKEMMEKLKSKDFYVILCDVKGKLMDSFKFSNFLFKLLTTKDVCFLIGGPDGVDEDMLKGVVNFKLSFSPMTFNHEVFRIMLLEQIYRAIKIREAHPYSLH